MNFEMAEYFSLFSSYVDYHIDLVYYICTAFSNSGLLIFYFVIFVLKIISTFKLRTVFCTKC